MSGPLSVLFFAVGGGLVGWYPVYFLGRSIMGSLIGAHLARIAVRRDVFLTRDEILDVARFDWTQDGSSNNAPDTKAAQRHPGWSTREVLGVLIRDKVVTTSPVDAIECAGAWLRHSGAVLSVPVGEDPDALLGRVLQAVEDGRRASHIYLSRQDVYDLAHHNAVVPVNRGYHYRHVERRYPGWSWGELHGSLQRSGHMRRDQHLPEGFVGVLIDRVGEVVLDDGSLVHPAREQSWAHLGDHRRRPEHCVFSTYGIATGVLGRGGGAPVSPVIIHAPHTSRHIPDAVRRELLLGDTELTVELDAVTDAGVLAVVEALTGPLPTIALATMSRLVFDPERFPVDDPMEQVGMGLVYMKRADGAALRSLLTPERLDWYRAQHRSYTVAIERLVKETIDLFAAAVILDLHSYPRDPLGYENPSRDRPEVCIGTDPFHTPAWLESLAVESLSARFEVGVNTPFAGSYVPGCLYQSEPRVSSLMVEVRRDVLLTAGGLESVVAAVSRIVTEATSHVTAHEAGL